MVTVWTFDKESVKYSFKILWEWDSILASYFLNLWHFFSAYISFPDKSFNPFLPPASPGWSTSVKWSDHHNHAVHLNRIYCIIYSRTALKMERKHTHLEVSVLSLYLHCFHDWGLYLNMANKSQEDVILEAIYRSYNHSVKALQSVSFWHEDGRFVKGWNTAPCFSCN